MCALEAEKYRNRNYLIWEPSIQFIQSEYFTNLKAPLTLDALNLAELKVIHM